MEYTFLVKENEVLGVVFVVVYIFFIYIGSEIRF